MDITIASFDSISEVNMVGGLVFRTTQVNVHFKTCHASIGQSSERQFGYNNIVSELMNYCTVYTQHWSLIQTFIH
ncbi:hypothetical protein E2C01_053296 [Portunus trituberculatus]|uniref:Uncharacterized protein n=1 Tax=Portunus trituberculatus TaxID=210409 RepID=A0A5B7GG75_PORTR|nr:hypothetical protein [Portunus trituberculatus]